MWRQMTCSGTRLAPVLLLLLLPACPRPMPTPVPTLTDIASMLLQGFADLDQDGNGLDFTEARQEIASLTVAQFDALDTDGDGLLSRTELADAAGEPPGDPLASNAYSWDGSWAPLPGELPPPGLYDRVYFDGRPVNGEPSPILPPGDWDYVDSETLDVAPLGNYNSFTDRVATPVPLVDDDGRPYGWRFDSVNPGAMEIDFTADSYHGSSGADLWDTGPEGFIRFSADFNTGDGPDVLRVAACSASSVRTGSDLRGSLRDNDLVIVGDEGPRDLGDPAMRGATIHTGPGDDLVFVNNMEQAAIDLGNGAGGRTDTLDPTDGDDILVAGGNLRDCRIFGGNGDDLFVWYIDETGPTDRLLANSFFGAGGWAPAVWEDTGMDRLILVVPDDTEVTSGPGSATGDGTVEVGIRPGFPDTPVPDGPTEDNVFTRYYGIAGRSPEGNRQTVYISYRSASGHVDSGDILLTAVEELQIGIGPAAKVYRIDDVNGAAVLDPGLLPRRTIPSRAAHHDLVDALLAP